MASICLSSAEANGADEADDGGRHAAVPQDPGYRHRRERLATFGGDFREPADFLHARGVELLGTQVAVRLAGARVGGDAL